MIFRKPLIAWVLAAFVLVGMLGINLRQRAQIADLEYRLSKSPAAGLSKSNSILGKPHSSQVTPAGLPRANSQAQSGGDNLSKSHSSLFEELETLKNEPSPLNRTLVEFRLSQITAEEALDAFAFLSNHTETGRASNEMWHIFWKRWGQVDPEAALRQADRPTPNYSEKDRVRKHVFEGLAEIDPNAAAALILDKPEMKDRHRAIEGLSVKWAHTDPANATRWALENLEDNELWSAVGGIPWGINSTQGYAEALEWWHELPNQEVKRHAFRSLTEIYSANRYEVTFEDRLALWQAGVETDIQRTDLTSRVASEFAGKDPEAGVEMFSKWEQPDSDSGLYQGINSLVQTWAQRDLETTGIWLMNQLEEPWADSAIWAYANQTRDIDGKAAEAWVTRIRDDAIRERWQP